MLLSIIISAGVFGFILLLISREGSRELPPSAIPPRNDLYRQYVDPSTSESSDLTSGVSVSWPDAVDPTHPARHKGRNASVCDVNFTIPDGLSWSYLIESRLGEHGSSLIDRMTALVSTMAEISPSFRDQLHSDIADLISLAAYRTGSLDWRGLLLFCGICRLQPGERHYDSAARLRASFAGMNASNGQLTFPTILETVGTLEGKVEKPSGATCQVAQLLIYVYTSATRVCGDGAFSQAAADDFERELRDSLDQRSQAIRDRIGKEDRRRHYLEEHELLGTSPASSLEEIRSAYHTKVTQWHPDRLEGMAPELRELATQKLVAITNAYSSITSQASVDARSSSSSVQQQSRSK